MSSTDETEDEFWDDTQPDLSLLQPEPARETMQVLLSTEALAQEAVNLLTVPSIEPEENLLAELLKTVQQLLQWGQGLEAKIDQIQAEQVKQRAIFTIATRPSR